MTTKTLELRYAPSTWNLWSDARTGLAILAAFKEFPHADVYLQPYGIEVFVEATDSLDLEWGNARLRAACDYAVVDS